jgi:hypothetical protein
MGSRRESLAPYFEWLKQQSAGPLSTPAASPRMMTMPWPFRKPLPKKVSIIQLFWQTTLT